MNLSRRTTAEGVGTALLLAAIVGSGVMAERLAGGAIAVALLANAIATGAALIGILLAFGPVSGAHFNPEVTIMDAWRGGVAWPDVPAYVGAQIVGAIAGVAIADVMLGFPPFFMSYHARDGAPQLLGAFYCGSMMVWGLPNPKGQSHERVREIRDLVSRKAGDIAAELLRAKSGGKV